MLENKGQLLGPIKFFKKLVFRFAEKVVGDLGLGMREHFFFKSL